jgi:hypothetical protein
MDGKTESQDLHKASKASSTPSSGSAGDHAPTHNGEAENKEIMEKEDGDKESEANGSPGADQPGMTAADLSLPHEMMFVGIICMAQFLTRKSILLSCLHPAPSLMGSQNLPMAWA